MPAGLCRHAGPGVGEKAAWVAPEKRLLSACEEQRREEAVPRTGR